MISDHRINFNHDFKWKHVEILDNELNYKKRLISEMVHIKKQKLKKQTDIDPLFVHLSFLQFFYIFFYMNSPS